MGAENLDGSGQGQGVFPAAKGVEGGTECHGRVCNLSSLRVTDVVRVLKDCFFWGLDLSPGTESGGIAHIVDINEALVQVNQDTYVIMERQGLYCESCTRGEYSFVVSGYLVYWYPEWDGKDTTDLWKGGYVPLLIPECYGEVRCLELVGQT